MSYFPFFVDLEGVPALVVGGGTVALRKVEKLLPYAPSITVVSPAVSEEIASHPEVTVVRRPFRPEDLDGQAFVIAAAGPETDLLVAELCRQRGIPVNVVDDPKECTFLFPALVKRGNLSVGISTEGASPTAAAYLKQRVEGILPRNIEAVLSFMEECRPLVKREVEDASRRQRVFAELFWACIEEERPLTHKELEEVLARHG